MKSWNELWRERKAQCDKGWLTESVRVWYGGMGGERVCFFHNYNISFCKKRWWLSVRFVLSKGHNSVRFKALTHLKALTCSTIWPFRIRDSRVNNNPQFALLDFWLTSRNKCPPLFDLRSLALKLWDYFELIYGWGLWVGWHPLISLNFPAPRSLRSFQQMLFVVACAQTVASLHQKCVCREVGYDYLSDFWASFQTDFLVSLIIFLRMFHFLMELRTGCVFLLYTWMKKMGDYLFHCLF